MTKPVEVHPFQEGFELKETPTVVADVAETVAEVLDAEAIPVREPPEPVPEPAEPPKGEPGAKVFRDCREAMKTWQRLTEHKRKLEAALSVARLDEARALEAYQKAKAAMQKEMES